MLSPRFLFFTTVLPPIRFRFPPACLISRSPSLELFLSEKWDTQISRCDDWLSQSKPYFPTTLLPCLQLRSNIMGFCDSVAVIHVSRLHTTSLSRNPEPQFAPPPASLVDQSITLQISSRSLPTHSVIVTAQISFRTPACPCAFLKFRGAAAVIEGWKKGPKLRSTGEFYLECG